MQSGVGHASVKSSKHPFQHRNCSSFQLAPVFPTGSLNQALKTGVHKGRPSKSGRSHRDLLRRQPGVRQQRAGARHVAGRQMHAKRGSSRGGRPPNSWTAAAGDGGTNAPTAAAQTAGTGEADSHSAGVIRIGGFPPHPRQLTHDLRAPAHTRQAGVPSASTCDTPSCPHGLGAHSSSVSRWRAGCWRAACRS